MKTRLRALFNTAMKRWQKGEDTGIRVQDAQTHSFHDEQQRACGTARVKVARITSQSNRSP